MDIKDKKEEQDNWKNFRGKGNSNEILIEKAEILATVIVDWVHTGTLKFIECLEEDEKNKNAKEKFEDIFLESIIFYIHFTDRTVFQLLNTEQRGFFMDTLIEKIIYIFSKEQQNEEQKVHVDSTIRNMCNERQIEYGKYKMTADKDEGLGGTLFWEFSKKISNIVGFEKDVITMAQAQICIIGGLQFLQLSKLFEK